MSIKHMSVGYYGLNYVEHAEKDFIEMKEHGCDTVILAITEFDMDFWFPNINNIGLNLQAKLRWTAFLGTSRTICFLSHLHPLQAVQARTGLAAVLYA